MSYKYRWFKNDSPLDGASGSSLTASDLARHDHLVVEGVVADDESASPPFRSEALVIDNLPPRFSSQPLKPRTSDDAFRYQVLAVDPDRDPLHFELVSAPIGMTLQPEGLIVWALPPPHERRGDHRVSVKVSDSNGGEAIQEFSLHFDPSETNP